MKTYDVTINLRIVSLKYDVATMKPVDAMKQYLDAAQALATSIAGNDTMTACEVLNVGLVDHDSLPKQAHICARCNERKGA